MEERESRFDRLIDKITMFLNQKDTTPSMMDNSQTELLMFKKDRTKLKRYIYEQDLPIEIVGEKEIAGDVRKVKVILRKL